jgi:hypothetical protein
MTALNLPTGPQLIASAAKYLIEGGENDVATILLSCTVDSLRQVVDGYSGEPVSGSYSLDLIGPRIACECLSNSRNGVYKKVWSAVSTVLPHSLYLNEINIRAGLVTLEPDWHAEMVELASGKSVDNQAADAGASRIWNRLRFRSATEIKIAEALDKAKVLFFPLSRARLNGPTGRVNREPDFLVCKDGKWGILEVDGEPYHPPQRTVHDHERDRLFQQHGIRLVQHYDSTDCYVTPDKVVAEFLALLARAY